MNIPEKLKVDAIVEAILEIRFDCDESRRLPEIVVGKLAQFEKWRDFSVTRLPVAEMPIQLRKSDSNLKYNPVIELRSASGQRVVKVGENALSYHVLQEYPGWSNWKHELAEVIAYIYSCLSGLSIDRVGLRYVNLFTFDDHGVSGVRDLNFSVAIAGGDLDLPMNLNYSSRPSEVHSAVTRIASPEFVGSPTKSNMTALVDIDISTDGAFQPSSAEKLIEWVGQAHDHEKSEFFRLFTERMRELLVEEEGIGQNSSR